MLVNKKLKQAQRLYEKNQQGRAAFMQNISNTLKEPVRQLAVNAAAVTTPESLKLADQADVLVRMIDEIQLANMLENDAWKSEATLFSCRILLTKSCRKCCPPLSVRAATAD